MLCRQSRDTNRNITFRAFTILIGSTPTFLYFDLYLYSAYAAQYIHFWLRYTSTCYWVHYARSARSIIYVKHGKKSARLLADILHYWIGYIVLLNKWVELFSKCMHAPREQIIFIEHTPYKKKMTSIFFLVAGWHLKDSRSEGGVYMDEGQPSW